MQKTVLFPDELFYVRVGVGCPSKFEIVAFIADPEKNP
jgi:hypothetical protein